MCPSAIPEHPVWPTLMCVISVCCGKNRAFSSALSFERPFPQGLWINVTDSSFVVLFVDLLASLWVLTPVARPLWDQPEKWVKLFNLGFFHWGFAPGSRNGSWWHGRNREDRVRVSCGPHACLWLGNWVIRRIGKKGESGKEIFFMRGQIGGGLSQTHCNMSNADRIWPETYTYVHPKSIINNPIFILIFWLDKLDKSWRPFLNRSKIHRNRDIMIQLRK